MKALNVCLVAGCLFWALTGAAQPALAGEGLSVREAWIRFAPPTARVHAGYFILKNDSDRQRVLVGAKSPRYGRVELHRSVETNGVMKMESVKSIALESGESVTFKPGGRHLMMFDPRSLQKLGETVSLSLLFETGEILQVRAQVLKAGEKNGSNGTLQSKEEHHHH